MGGHAIRLTPERFKELQEKARQHAPGPVPVPKVQIRPKSPQAGAIKATKRSKHGAVKTECDGFLFDSKLEALCWGGLRLREKRGQIRDLRRQVAFSLYAPGGYHLRVWRADFVFEERVYKLGDKDNWPRRVCDAKSAHTRTLPGWKDTKALMQACHGVTVIELP